MLKNKAYACGLTNLKFGIDEGCIVRSADNKDISARIIEHTFQASSDAAMFKLMNDLNADWFSTWGVNNKNLWSELDLVTTHVVNLCYKMVVYNQIEFNVEGKPTLKSDKINGMAAYDKTANKIYVMVYNYNADLGANTTEKPAILIENIKSIGPNVKITEWVIDDTH